MQELFVLLVAASPVVELRGAIPLGLLVYGLPLWQVFILAIIGNMIPILLLPVLGVLVQELSLRSVFFKKLFIWLFDKTRKRHAKMFELLRNFALVLFVAIPLPFTGVWTAMLAAFVFGIPFRKAFPLILFGVIMAAVIISALSLRVLAT